MTTPPHGYELDDDQITPRSPDFRTELAKQLAEIAPEAVADGKIDVETLKELLEGDASDTSERFGLFWPGKKRAMRAAQTPTSATLVPDFENSKDWDTTKNVFIEGDNLEVLKILQKHYHGKIKMIYIDPPYNTGKDFVYPDNYREGLDNYLEWSKQVNEEGQKLSTNTDTGGRLHTNWLNMMYPRLKLARNLLTDDGLIIMSIDDAEMTHLVELGKEIFGEGAFGANILWKKRNTPPNDRAIGAQHDYLVVFGRNDLRGVRRRARSSEQLARYKNPDNHPKGPWVAGDLSANVKGGRYVESLNYPITNPNTGVEYYPPNKGNWRFNSQRIAELLENDEIYFGKEGTGAPKLKRFLSDIQEGTTWTSWWDFVPYNTAGTKEVRELFDDQTVFDNPKPTGLLAELIKLATSENSIVLDFFSGSASTAHAVMLVNAEDGGSRRYIQVQLPEPTPLKGTAREAGYSTISEISRERIRRAGEKLKQSNSKRIADRSTLLDTGFRAYKLSDTNFTKWHLTADAPANEVEQHILDIQESSKDSATQDALLTELLLKQGMSLTEQVTQFEVAELHCHAVLNADSEADAEDRYVLIAYVDEHTKPTLDQLRAVVELQPARLVILEDAFQGDDQLKTNLKQMCVTNDIELKTA